MALLIIGWQFIRRKAIKEKCDLSHQYFECEILMRKCCYATPFDHSKSWLTRFSLYMPLILLSTTSYRGVGQMNNMWWALVGVVGGVLNNTNYRDV